MHRLCCHRPPLSLTLLPVDVEQLKQLDIVVSTGIGEGESFAEIKYVPGNWFPLKSELGVPSCPSLYK